ncbi:OPN1LW [Branchiostoma lanceolatum]|uniref:OPN1LW protein n=1 Tax=Branchiostoma lanceolatum TaxID=7740 RepID=A0A8J9VBK3_BRALA|nr:OPN1LW [Branchiostoma lanceolatum]
MIHEESGVETMEGGPEGDNATYDLLPMLQPTTVTAAATFLGMTMFLGTVGNMMVLYSFLRNKALRTAANGLIANLSASDLVACTVASPIALVVVLSQDPLPPPVCDLQTFVSTLCNLVTLLMLLGISVDRWLNINYPFTGSRTKVTRVACGTMFSWTVGLTVASVEAALPTTSHFYERCIMRNSPGSQGYIPLQIYSLVPLAMLSLVVVTGCYMMIVRAVRTHVKRRARTKQPIIVVQEVDGGSAPNYGTICPAEASTYEPPVPSVCTPSDYTYSGGEDEPGGETLYLAPITSPSLTSQEPNIATLSTSQNIPSPPNSSYSSSPCTPNVSPARQDSEDNVTSDTEGTRKDSVTYRMTPPKDEEEIDVESCLRRSSVEDMILKQAGKFPKSNFLTVPGMPTIAPKRRKSSTTNPLAVPVNSETADSASNDSAVPSLNQMNGSSSDLCLAVPVLDCTGRCGQTAEDETVIKTPTKIETETLCIPTSPITNNYLVVACPVGTSDNYLQSADTDNGNALAVSRSNNPVNVPCFKRSSSPGPDEEDRILLTKLKEPSKPLHGSIVPVPSPQDCLPLASAVAKEHNESTTLAKVHTVAEGPTALPKGDVSPPRSPVASPMRTRRKGVTSLPPEFKARKKSEDYLVVPSLDVEFERRPSAPQLVPFTGRFLAVPPINIAKERRVSAPSYSPDPSEKSSKPHRESIACSNPTSKAQVDKSLKKPKRESIAVSTPRWKTSLRSLLSLRSHEEEVIEEEEEEEEEEEVGEDCKKAESEQDNLQVDQKNCPMIPTKRRISWNLPMDQCSSEENSSQGGENTSAEGSLTVDVDGACVRYHRSDNIAGDDVSLREDSGIHMPADANHVISTVPVVPDGGDRDLYLSVPRRKPKRVISRERLSTISFSSDRSLSKVSTVSQASSYSGEYRSRSRTATMDRSAAKRSVYIVLTFVLAWMPLPVIILVGCFINDPQISDAETIAYVLMMASRMVHPILYACFNKGFRTEFKRMIKVMVCRPTAPQGIDN